MYTKTKPTKTTLRVNKSYQGETIEQKINRIVNNKEPIKDGAPLVYTERKDGVRPEYNIRTDRWDIAVEAMDHISKTAHAKRQARIDALMQSDQDKTKGGEQKGDGGAESTQGTDNK